MFLGVRGVQVGSQNRLNIEAQDEELLGIDFPRFRPVLEGRLGREVEPRSKKVDPKTLQETISIYGVCIV